MTKEDDMVRYQRASHKVQAGLAFLENTDPARFMPKHLRTGIDMSKSDQRGLANLLIDKGVFTEDEYISAMADAAEIEAADMETYIEQKLGRKVTLI